MEQRSTRDLLTMVLGREHGQELLERAGGLEILSEAEPAEIVEWLITEENSNANPRADRTKAEREKNASGCAKVERGKIGNAVFKSARAVAAAFELGRRVAIARARIPDRFDSADKVAAWARPRLAYLSHEELWIVALDGRGHLKATRCIARGGPHGASVQAGDPLRVALRVGASAFVLVHNHPSGDPTPSKEDIVFTMRVAEGARLLGIVLLDHLIVSKGGFSSIPIGDDGGADDG